MPLRLVLADDAALIRQALAELLQRAGVQVVAQAGNAPSLLRAVEDHQPDVAIVDIRMPPTQTTEGIRAALQIRERFPATGILLLSTHTEIDEAVELFSATASGVGYLLKDSVSTSTNSPARSPGSATAAPSSTRNSSPNSLAAHDGPTPSMCSRPENARWSGSWPRGNQTPGSPRPCG